MRKTSRDIVEVKGSGRGGWSFVSTTPIDEPECARPESVIEQTAWLLAKIKASKDEASQEVIEYLKVEPLADAIADTIRQLPMRKTMKLRDWTYQAITSRIYPYANINAAAVPVGRFFIITGIMLTTGGPRDKELAAQTVPGYGTYDMLVRSVPALLVKVASGKMQSQGLDGVRRDLNELPMVEVKSERAYNEACEALEISKRAWKGPGIYDFSYRRTPPSFVVRTEDEYRYAVALERAIESIADIRKLTNELRDACAALRKKRV